AMHPYLFPMVVFHLGDSTVDGCNRIFPCVILCKLLTLVSQCRCVRLQRPLNQTHVLVSIVSEEYKISKTLHGTCRGSHHRLSHYQVLIYFAGIIADGKMVDLLRVDAYIETLD